jgi:hypothetical protein
MDKVSGPSLHQRDWWISKKAGEGYAAPQSCIWEAQGSAKCAACALAERFLGTVVSRVVLLVRPEQSLQQQSYAQPPQDASADGGGWMSTNERRQACFHMLLLPCDEKQGLNSSCNLPADHCMKIRTDGLRNLVNCDLQTCTAEGCNIFNATFHVNNRC